MGTVAMPAAPDPGPMGWPQERDRGLVALQALGEAPDLSKVALGASDPPPKRVFVRESSTINKLEAGTSGRSYTNVGGGL